MLPTDSLKKPTVWEALLDKMPLTAMLRNLGRLSALGVLAPMSDASLLVCDRLCDPVRLKRARIHPLSVLVAQKVFAQGRGEKGSLTWATVPQVIDALDDSFYAAFGAIEPTGKRWFLGCDVSGSMSSPVAGSPLQCREAVAALSLVTAKTEPNYVISAFSSRGWSSTAAGQGYWGAHCPSGIEVVDFSRLTRLDYAVKKMAEIPMGSTDCALPMLYALEQKIPVDVFVVMTDNETWAGNIHPCQALVRYREQMGIRAKLVVMGMVANNFTIADPSDAGMLDVVGFDTAVPQIMRDFAG
jgi:60 kDa SS-A/Ro ribonucleoprotein